jgi:hypothetical protein
LPDRCILRRLGAVVAVPLRRLFRVVWDHLRLFRLDEYFLAIAALLPFYRDLRGTLMEIVYAVTSAVWFAVFGILGGLAALLFNVISSFVGESA